MENTKKELYNELKKYNTFVIHSSMFSESLLATGVKWIDCGRTNKTHLDQRHSVDLFPIENDFAFEIDRVHDYCLDRDGRYSIPFESEMAWEKNGDRFNINYHCEKNGITKDYSFEVEASGDDSRDDNTEPCYCECTIDDMADERYIDKDLSCVIDDKMYIVIDAYKLGALSFEQQRELAYTYYLLADEQGHRANCTPYYAIDKSGHTYYGLWNLLSNKPMDSVKINKDERYITSEKAEIFCKKAVEIITA